VTEKIEFATSIRGALQESEDWWRLVIESNGSMFVEHEWSHANSHKVKTNSGTKRFPISDFLDRGAGPTDELLTLLKERGIHA
jgi:hypothetical protein